MMPEASVGAGENRAGCRGLVAIHALAAWALLLQGNAAHGGAGFFLDFGFTLAAPTPKRIREPALHSFLQVAVGLCVVRIAFAERQRLVVERLLNFDEQFLDCARQIGKRRADFSFFAWTVATRENRGLLRYVLGTKLDAQRDAAHLPVIELPARALPFAFVHSHANLCLC